MITLTTNLSKDWLNSIKNCAKFCFQTPAATTECKAASFTITISSTATNPTDQTFTIGGYGFKVDNALPEGGATGFKMPWDLGDVTKLRNELELMLKQSYFFGNKCKFQRISTNQLKVTFKECGFWQDAELDFSPLTYEPSYSVDAGSDLEPIDGFAFIYEIYRLAADDEFYLVGDTKTLTPYIADDKNGIACVDIWKNIAGFFDMGMPRCGTPMVTPLYNFRQYFYVSYGTRWNKETCGVNFGAFKNTDTFGFVPSVFQWENIDAFEPYMFKENQNKIENKLIKFLTARPETMPACESMCETINVYLNAESATGNNYTYDFNVRYRINNGVWSEWENFDKKYYDGVYQINVSPADLPIFISPDYKTEYEIAVFDHGSGDQITEAKRFQINPGGCGCDAYIYFIDDLGCWSAIRALKRQSEDLDIGADIICAENECRGNDSYGPTPIFRGGRNRANLSSDSTYTYITDMLDRTEVNRKYLMQFLQSPQHYIVRADADYYFQKITLQPGTFRLKEERERIATQFSFTYNLENKVRDYQEKKFIYG